ncbi:transcriptional regulator [Actinokineospora inagensis]|uniref:transcriptional regulator n=1 Tax=Actinokineospora inagensis TaxID=103730 RepID=UPI000407B9DA|nr:transcriptional regulator [Actinokineospora inagensis]
MAGVTGDYAAVARVIQQRLVALGMSQATLIERSSVSKAVVGELQHNKVQRSRSENILRAIAEVLDLHTNHLIDVAQGRAPQPVDEPSARSADDVAGRLDVLDYRTAEILKLVRELREHTLGRVDVNFPERTTEQGPRPSRDSE